MLNWIEIGKVFRKPTWLSDPTIAEISFNQWSWGQYSILVIDKNLSSSSCVI